MERMRGIVIAVRPRRVLVRAQGREYSCPVWKRITRGERTARAPLAVGDRVSIEISSGGSSTLMEVEPRRTQISRLAGIPPREQVIAANVDRVLALQAVDQPPFEAAALDRLLVIAEAGGVQAAIGLNKTDLAKADGAENRSGPGHAEQRWEVHSPDPPHSWSLPAHAGRSTGVGTRRPHDHPGRLPGPSRRRGRARHSGHWDHGSRGGEASGPGPPVSRVLEPPGCVPVRRLPSLG